MKKKRFYAIITIVEIFGEYETGCKMLYTRPDTMTDKQIEKDIMKDWRGKGEKDGSMWLYCGGECGAKLKGIRYITKAQYEFAEKMGF